jgi:hypothetical protein
LRKRDLIGKNRVHTEFTEGGHRDYRDGKNYSVAAVPNLFSVSSV